MLLEGLSCAEQLVRERDQHARADEAGGEFVWTWLPNALAVVLGQSCMAETEANVEACEADGVPILRRDSGGGTVLVGPGCVNYSVILSIERAPKLRDVDASYGVILDEVLAAVRIAGARREGTDLTLDGRKFAGCSQRRLRRTVLHHGTILRDFDLEKVTRYLREPPKRPAHRGERSHAEFLRNVPLNGDFAGRLAARFPEAQLIA